MGAWAPAELTAAWQFWYDVAKWRPQHKPQIERPMQARTFSPPTLERNAVGLPAVLFQSITHMAPAAAVAYSIIVGVPYAGGSIPLAITCAFIAAVITFPMMRWAVAFMGGLCGAAIGVSVWRTFNLDINFAGFRGAYTGTFQCH